MRKTKARMTIGGTTAESSEGFAVLNPATEAPYADAPSCTKAQLNTAFEEAEHAQPGWAADDEARRNAMARASRSLLTAEEDIALLLTAEQGKPLPDARREVQAAARWFSYYATLDVPYEETYPIEDGGKTVGIFRPLGVVAAIAPWNFPITLASWKLAPALRAGNTAVLKPSPHTPLATLKMGEILNEVLPSAVVSVVSGDDEVGRWMTQHPVPRKINFTGSIRGGMAVAAASAADLKRITLELGGNDAAIVLDDVDAASVAQSLFWGAFYNNGQVCGCIKRLYVHEYKSDELATELASIASSIKVGDGMDEGTILGPINNQMQFDRVTELCDDAVENGAEAAFGGHRIGERGYFREPTILAKACDGMRVVDEEQFGPVLPIVPYRDVEEAVANANATHFGLGGSVWGADSQRANAVARRLNAANIWINRHGVIGPSHPFGGSHWSGLGVTGGLWGLRAHMQLHAIHES